MFSERRFREWLVAALVAAAFVAVGCGKSKEADDAEKGGPVPDVTVTKVTRAAILHDLFVSGNLAAPPNHDAKLSALVPGRIAQVFVIEGQQVTAGQPLAEMDNSVLRDQERQAEAAVAQARANVENAKRSAERNETLLQRGIAARKEVEDARTQLSVNQAAMSQAEAALATARTQLSRGTLRAPFAGTVVRRFLGMGEQVDGTSAQPVVEIANIDTVELIGTVPASRLGEINTGKKFTFTTSSAPGETFTSEVVSVFPAVDPATNNGTIRIRIDNSKHVLKLGTYISVELPVSASRSALVVPRQAIYPDEAGEPHVYKVNGDEAAFVPVELGIQTKDQAEIVSGVQEGDTVILAGGYGLPEKSKVHVK